MANPFPVRLWLQDLFDRLKGRPERILARWGRFRAPGGPGPLAWVYAPSCAQAATAAELVRGIRSVRVDVRAVVMAESGCGETIRPILADYPGTAAAPAIADHPRAARNCAQRLGPSGLVAVGELPPAGILKGVATAGVPVAVVGAEPPSRLPAGLQIAHVVPVGEAQAARWSVAGITPEEPVDLEALLVRTDVEPTLRAALIPGEGRRLLWTDALPEDPEGREAFLARWCTPERTLVVASAEPPRVGDRPIVALSRWDAYRRPVEPGTVVWLDEARWLPAVAASAFAAALWRDDRHALWEALAAGVPALVGGAAGERLRDLGVAMDTGALTAPDWETVEAQWAEWEGHPFTWRDQQGRARRTFWEARQRAEQGMAVLDRWVDGW